MGKRSFSNEKMNFVKKHVHDLVKFTDPDFVKQDRRAKRKDVNAASGHSEKIAARKKLAHAKRRELMAQLAQDIKVFEPQVMDNVRDKFAKLIEKDYRRFLKRIDDVDEDQFYRQGRGTLREIEADMAARFKYLTWEVRNHPAAPTQELVELASGKIIDLWKKDIGAALQDALPKELDFLSIGKAPMFLQVEDTFVNLLKEDNDYITPYALIDELNEIFDLCVATLSEQLKSGLTETKQAAIDDAKAQKFDDDQTRDFIEFKLQMHVNSTLQTLVAQEIRRMESEITSHIEVREAQVLRRRSDLKWRPLRKKVRFVMPVLGIVLGVLGVTAAVTGGFLTAPTIAGPLVAVSVGFASVTVIRSSLALIKSEYLLHSSLDHLTKALESDLRNLASRYDEKGGTNVKEFGAAFLNAAAGWPILESLPSINAQVDEMEMRVASLVDQNRKQHAKAEELIAQLAKERKALVDHYGEKEAKAYDEKMAAAYEKASEFLNNISDKASKSLLLQSKFGRIRTKLAELEDMVSGTVKNLSAASALLIDFALLIGAAGVGVGGVATACSEGEAIVGTVLTLVSEASDGGNILAGELDA